MQIARSGGESFAVALLGAIFVLAPAGTAGAQSKCSAGELKATGKRAAAKLTCHAKAVGAGDPVDGSCLGKAEEKFDAAFAKAVSKGSCLTAVDAGAIATTVDTLVADVASALGGPGPSKCTKKKLTATGKASAAEANCHAKAVGKGDAIDADCLAKAQGKFEQAFVKAAAKEDCVVSGDDTTFIGGKVEAFIAEVRDGIAPAGATTTTTVASTTTTTITCHLDGPSFSCVGGCGSGLVCGSIGPGPGSCGCIPVSEVCGPAMCGVGCPGSDPGQICDIHPQSGVCECYTPCGANPVTCGGYCSPVAGGAIPRVCAPDAVLNCHCCIAQGGPCFGPGDCCSNNCSATTCQ